MNFCTNCGAQVAAQQPVDMEQTVNPSDYVVYDYGAVHSNCPV